MDALLKSASAAYGAKAILFAAETEGTLHQGSFETEKFFKLAAVTKQQLMVLVKYEFEKSLCALQDIQATQFDLNKPSLECQNLKSKKLKMQ